MFCMRRLHGGTLASFTDALLSFICVLTPCRCGAAYSANAKPLFCFARVGAGTVCLLMSVRHSPGSLFKTLRLAAAAFRCSARLHAHLRADAFSFDVNILRKSRFASPPPCVLKNAFRASSLLAYTPPTDALWARARRMRWLNGFSSGRFRLLSV